MSFQLVFSRFGRQVLAMDSVHIYHEVSAHYLIVLYIQGTAFQSDSTIMFTAGLKSAPLDGRIEGVDEDRILTCHRSLCFGSYCICFLAIATRCQECCSCKGNH